MSAIATDADGDPLSLRFNISAGDSCYLSPWTAPGVNSFTIPKEMLFWNTRYYWAAMASDGVLQTEWTTEERSFYTDDYDFTNTNESAFGYPSHVGFSSGFDQGGMVNHALGSFTRTDIDALVAAAGPGLAVERTFNSSDGVTGTFGRGWSSLLDARLITNTATSSMFVVLPDGRREWHGKNPTPPGSYAPPKGYFSTFDKPALDTARTWRLLTKDFTSLWFDAGSTTVLPRSDANTRIATGG